MPTTRPKDRRAAILDSAAELFAHKGVAGTTVREIADGVGMLSGSLYHHFESKDEMAEAILSAYIQEIVDRYEVIVAAHHDPRTTLDELIHVSFEIARANPHATEIWQSSGRLFRTSPIEILSKGPARITKTWMDVIDAGVAAGTFRDDVDPKVFYRLLRDALWLSVRWSRSKRGEYTAAKLADDCSRIFLEGFIAR